MQAARERLVLGLTALLESMDGLDYQVGVLSASADDAGALQGPLPFVTPSTPQAETRLREAMSDLSLGTQDGFHQAYLALAPPPMTAPNGTNDGFLRAGAGLRIVQFTQGYDQSAPIMGWTAVDYLGWFRSLKADPSSVVLSNIAGGLAGCSGALNSADPSTDYVLVANLTGGSTQSICALDLVPALEQIGAEALHLSDAFVLSSVPRVDTLEVAVNGYPRAGDWTFDEGRNAVVFDPDHVPENGDAVTVGFTPAPDCN